VVVAPLLLVGAIVGGSFNLKPQADLEAGSDLTTINSSTDPSGYRQQYQLFSKSQVLRFKWLIVSG